MQTHSSNDMWLQCNLLLSIFFLFLLPPLGEKKGMNIECLKNWYCGFNKCLAFSRDLNMYLIHMAYLSTGQLWAAEDVHGEGALTAPFTRDDREGKTRHKEYYKRQDYISLGYITNVSHIFVLFRRSLTTQVMAFLRSPTTDTLQRHLKDLTNTKTKTVSAILSVRQKTQPVANSTVFCPEYTRSGPGLCHFGNLYCCQRQKQSFFSSWIIMQTQVQKS